MANATRTSDDASFGQRAGGRRVGLVKRRVEACGKAGHEVRREEEKVV